MTKPIIIERELAMYRWILLILAFLLALLTKIGLRSIARIASEEVEAHGLDKHFGLPTYRS